MYTNGHLDFDLGGTSVDQKVYRSIIESLLYLCASMLNIMLSVYMCVRIPSRTQRLSSKGGQENHEISSSHTTTRKSPYCEETHCIHTSTSCNRGVVLLPFANLVAIC
jgi:hypothetical protein